MKYRYNEEFSNDNARPSYARVVWKTSNTKDENYYDDELSGDFESHQETENEYVRKEKKDYWEINLNVTKSKNFSFYYDLVRVSYHRFP